MGKIILTLLIAIPFLIFGNAIKKITHKRDMSPFKEVFYVLKSDSSIKHGKYRAEFGGKILLTGHYKMGLKDSIWTQYSLKGKIRSNGWYEKGKRGGIWEFFDNNGKLEQKIDFSHNQVLFYQTVFTNHLFQITSVKDTIMSILDRPPLYIGGMSRFNDLVAEELNMNPLHKANEKIEGLVYVTFTIDSMGKTTNHHVLKGISNACNDEALRVISTIPDEWLPGILNGKRVSVDYVVSFQFNTNLKKNKALLKPVLDPPKWTIDSEGFLKGQGFTGWGGKYEEPPE